MTIRRGARARLAARLLALPGVALVAACNSWMAPDPVILEIVSGNHQQHRMGATVLIPLTVRVSDLDGEPLVGALVEWRVIEGAGSVELIDEVTDATGLARMRFTLDSSRWENRVRAQMGLETVMFDAYGQPDDWLDVIEVVPGYVIEDGLLRAHVALHNHWIGPVWLTAGGRCQLPTVRLHNPAGELIYWDGADPCQSAPVSVEPEEALRYGDFWVSIDALEPGEYTVRFNFTTALEVGGILHEDLRRAAALPAVELTIPIENQP